MFTIEEIQTDLDKAFIECGYKVGDAPCEGGDWREVGATADMVLKYCQKLSINCYVHHSRNLLTYIAPCKKEPMRRSLTLAFGAITCVSMDQLRVVERIILRR